jgi:hypothetical protein
VWVWRRTLRECLEPPAPVVIPCMSKQSREAMEVDPGRCCSPHHGMPSNSRNEGSISV